MATTYADELAAVSRTPFRMVVLTMDYCANTFGVAPCTATGTKCYNTKHTCKDPSNYSLTTKDYTFTSISAPLPLKTGERPYLKGISYLATEIKDSFTVSGRVRMTFVDDDDDSDVGIDPYVTDRATTQGSFWKKFLARNPYYKKRPVKIYQGFIGSDGTCDYTQIWHGIIETIAMSNNGEITIEAIDMLKSIDSIDVPAKTDCKLLVSLDNTRTSMTLDKTSDLDSTGTIIIGEEIIQYSGNSTVTNILTDCTRAAYGTEATSHNVDSQVQKCRYYSPANPFDILHEMLVTDGEVSTVYIDSTAFDAAKTYPLAEPINYAALITKPTKLKTLYFDLLDHVDAKSWVAENLKITCQRECSNRPSRTYSTISDTENIIAGTGNANLNPESRMSRCALYWDKAILGDDEEQTDYGRVEIAIDADSESSFEYSEMAEKVIWSRWIHSSAGSTETMTNYTRNLVSRRVARHRDPEVLINLSVEIKDMAIKTGDYVQLESDVLLNTDGTTLAGDRCQVIKRQQYDEKIDLTLLKLQQRRVAFISAAAGVSSAYSTATDASREYGYIGGNNQRMLNDDPCYRIY